MSKARLLVGVLFFIWGTIVCSGVHAQSEAETGINKSRSDLGTNTHQIDFVVRLGQGGFRDSRSPEDQLGGGQLALDIKPWTIPLAISFTTEYYTNSANPTHSYEIDSLYAVNVLYVDPMKDVEKLSYFVGGGIGRLKVPKEESNPGQSRTGNLINLEAGINYLVYRKFGIYGAVKYLRAEKTENNIKVIDFNEWIGILGITYSFSFSR
jgi:hypothetical protein